MALQNDSSGTAKSNSLVLAEGKAHFRSREYAKAITALSGVGSDTTPEISYWLARSQLRAGLKQQAAELLAELCRTRRSQADYYYASSALAQIGDYAESLSVLRDAIDAFGDNVNLKLLQVRVLIASGSSAQALDRLSHLDIDHDEWAELFAAANYGAGNFEAARQQIRQLAGTQPNQENHLLRLAMIAYRLGDYPEAERLARQCFSLQPSNQNAQTLQTMAMARQGIVPQVERVPSEILRDQAAELRLAGDIKGAATALIKARKYAPDDLQVRSLLRELAPTMPVLHIYAGDRHLAHNAWILEAKADPSNFEIIRSLAVLHFYGLQEHLTKGDVSLAASSMRLAGQYWSMVLCSTKFHNVFAKDKTAVYGRELKANDVAKACGSASDAIFRTVLASISQFQGDKDDAKLLRRAYAAALGEVRAAEMMTKALKALGNGAPADLVIGGPSAVTEFGNLESAKDAIVRASKLRFDPVTARKLRNAYSGTTPEWALVEARAFDLAIEDLGAIANRSSEQKELLAESYYEMGVASMDDQGSVDAFKYWTLALKELGNIASPEISREIESLAIASCQPLTLNSQETSLDVSRDIATSIRGLSRYIRTEMFKNEVANTLYWAAKKEYTDPRGEVSRAEELLTDALQIKPMHSKATKLLSSILGTKATSRFSGVPERDRRDRYREAARLFTKAIELDPTNRQTRADAENFLDLLSRDITLSAVAQELREVVNARSVRSS